MVIEEHQEYRAIVDITSALKQLRDLAINTKKMLDVKERRVALEILNKLEFTNAKLEDLAKSTGRNDVLNKTTTIKMVLPEIKEFVSKKDFRNCFKKIGIIIDVISGVKGTIVTPFMIILVGTPGSGKSYIARAAFSHLPIKHICSDKFLEILLKRDLRNLVKNKRLALLDDVKGRIKDLSNRLEREIDFNTRSFLQNEMQKLVLEKEILGGKIKEGVKDPLDISSLDEDAYSIAMELRKRAGISNDKLIRLSLELRQNIIVESSGSQPSVEWLEEESKKVGYDTHILYVVTSLQVAIKRNNSRERKLPEKSLVERYQAVYNDLGNIRCNLPPEKIHVIINNDTIKEKDEMLFFQKEILKVVQEIMGNKVW
jgi:predicted ABC-type ATPase